MDSPHNNNISLNIAAAVSVKQPAAQPEQDSSVRSERSLDPLLSFSPLAVLTLAKQLQPVLLRLDMDQHMWTHKHAQHTLEA